MFGQSGGSGFGSSGFGPGQQQKSPSFGSSFSQQQAPAFGQSPQQQQQSAGFGSSFGQPQQSMSGFGSGSGFGQSNTSFGAKTAGGMGMQQNTSFGQSSSFGAPQTPASGFGQQSAGGFGGSQQTSGFGQQTPAFGQQPNTSFGSQSFGQSKPSGFGQTSSSFGQPSSGFGASATSPFQQQQQSSSFGQQASPFQQQTTSMGSFGSQPTATPSTGFGGTSSGFGATTQQSSTFGAASGFGSSFGAQQSTGTGFQASGASIGTKGANYQPLRDTSSTKDKKMAFASITSNEAFKRKSLEELRAEDYLHRPAVPGSGAVPASGFGQTSTSFQQPSASGFGSASQSTGFGGFGSTQPSQPAQQTQTGSFGFGSSAPKPATSTFGGFGSSSTPASTSFGSGGNTFGAPSTSFGQTSSTGFGSQPAQATSNGFGTSTGGFQSASKPLGGTAPTSGSTFGGFGASSSQQQQPSSGFSFGAASKPASSFNFSQPSQPQTSSFGGFGSAQSTQPSQSGGFSGSQSFGGFQAPKPPTSGGFSGFGQSMQQPSVQNTTVSSGVGYTGDWFETSFGSQRPLHHTQDNIIETGPAAPPNQIPDAYDPYGISRLSTEEKKDLPESIQKTLTSTDTQRDATKNRRERIRRYMHHNLTPSRSIEGKVQVRRTTAKERTKSPTVQPKITPRTPPSEVKRASQIPQSIPRRQEASLVSPQRQPHSHRATDYLKEDMVRSPKRTIRVIPRVSDIMRFSASDLERVPKIIVVGPGYTVTWRNVDLSCLSRKQLENLESLLKACVDYSPSTRAFSFEPQAPFDTMDTEVTLETKDAPDDKNAHDKYRKRCEDLGADFIGYEDNRWSFVIPPLGDDE